MWADLCLGPWANGRKKVSLWDNYGPHKVSAVRSVFEGWGIALESLPPNMTAELQVMDLVVNGPLKSYMRRFHCQELFGYFQRWKLDVYKARSAQNPAERMLPKFSRLSRT